MSLKKPLHFLCLNTATETGGAVALCRAFAGKRQPEILAEKRLPHDQKQTATLLPSIVGLLKAADFSPADIKAIALNIGPGSFTGIRVGLATAQGIAYRHQTPLIGISTLTTLNLNALPWIKLHRGQRLLVCPLLDARKKEIYASIFEWQSGTRLKYRKKISDVHAEPQEFLQRFIKPYFNKKNLEVSGLLFIGNAAEVYETHINEFIHQELPPSVHAMAWGSGDAANPQSRPLAKLAWNRWEKGKTATAETLLPIYPRSIAEEFPQVKKAARP